MSDIEELTKIVGEENVLCDKEVIGAYSHDESFASPVRPKFVVTPRNAEHVQMLVKWANETSTSLIPVSSGTPHFRGDTVPSANGAVVVDLSRMKKITRVDKRNMVATIEPGVTFYELQLELQKYGLRLNMPLLPRNSKSVIGSMLEREPVIMPKYHWDISDPLGCIEVVFGTGDFFRTGSAAGAVTLEEQHKLGAAQINPLGPAQMDWHRVIQGAQGTMGIVTWATVRCEQAPKLEEPFLVACENPGKLFELVHWLIRLRLVNECLILNNTNIATILTNKYPGENRELKSSLPPWTLFFCIAGYDYLPEERVAYQVDQMKSIATGLGVEPVKAIKQLQAAQILKKLRESSDEPHWKLRYKGSCVDIFFLTTYDKIPEFIDVMHNAAHDHKYPVSDIGIYIQPIVQGTSCHCEFNLFFDQGNPKKRQDIQALVIDTANLLMKKGAFFSRPYYPLTDLIYSNDSATAATLRIVKDILDPNHIMNRGKLCFQS